MATTLERLTAELEQLRIRRQEAETKVVAARRVLHAAQDQELALHRQFEQAEGAERYRLENGSWALAIRELGLAEGELVMRKQLFGDARLAYTRCETTIAQHRKAVEQIAAAHERLEAQEARLVANGGRWREAARLGAIADYHEQLGIIEKSLDSRHPSEALGALQTMLREIKEVIEPMPALVVA